MLCSDNDIRMVLDDIRDDTDDTEGDDTCTAYQGRRDNTLERLIRQWQQGLRKDLKERVGRLSSPPPTIALDFVQLCRG